MKTKIFAFATALALSIGLCACHDDPKSTVEPVGTGSVNLKSIGIDVSNAEKVIETSRTSVDLSDFQIKIYKESGELSHEWTYSSMPEVFELPVGKYNAKVFSHTVEKAAWDAPYFVGEKAFEIVNDNITDLGIVTCKLANIKVSIRYSSELRKYMGDDVKVTVMANDDGVLVFTPEETRSGYFEAIEGSSTIIVEFNGTVNGTMETLRHTITDAAAGQHRIVTFKVKTPPGTTPTDPTGGIDPGTGIGIDVEVTDEDMNANIPNEEELLDPSDRPGGESGGGDEPGPDTPPVDPDDPVNTITITSDNVNMDAPNDVAGLSQVIVKISAPKGITHLMVNISSTSEAFIASAGELLPLNFDLAYPGDLEDALASLGFPVGEGDTEKGYKPVIGETAIDFDISQFVPLLGNEQFKGTHEFKLTVQDADNMQMIKTLVIVNK